MATSAESSSSTKKRAWDLNRPLTEEELQKAVEETLASLEQGNISDITETDSENEDEMQEFDRNLLNLGLAQDEVTEGQEQIEDESEDRPVLYDEMEDSSEEEKENKVNGRKGKSKNKRNKVPLEKWKNKDASCYMDNS